MYTRYFWQGSHHTYGHIRCVCTALANPTHESTAADHPSNNCTRAPASVQCHRPAVSDLTANVTRKHSCLQHPTLFYPQDPAHATWRAAADDRLAALLCTQGTPAFLRHWYANRLCVFVCACASLVRKQDVCVCLCVLVRH